MKIYFVDECLTNCGKNMRAKINDDSRHEMLWQNGLIFSDERIVALQTF